MSVPGLCGVARPGYDAAVRCCMATPPPPSFHGGCGVHGGFSVPLWWGKGRDALQGGGEGIPSPLPGRQPMPPDHNCQPQRYL